MSKALFFDIDGTLYNFQGVMPKSTKRALAKAREQGHQLIICTGRSMFQIYPELLCEFDGVIGSTGAIVKRGEQVIYEHYMPADTIKQIEAVFRDENAHIAAMTEHQMILNEACKAYMLDRFGNRYGGEQFVRRVLGDYRISDSFLPFSNIKKFLYYDASITVQAVSELLSGVCDVTPSSIESERKCSGEISVKGINKSLGIAKYIEASGICRQDTVAFGDGPNDLDMVEYAHIGVAMGNGVPALKERADFVTKGIQEDGIEYAMKTLGIIA